MRMHACILRLQVIGTILASSILPTSAWAATSEIYPLACQNIEASGLVWENGKWRQSLFQPNPPFFLQVVDGRLKREGVAAILGMPVDCDVAVAGDNYETCRDTLGGGFFYNFVTAKGGVSQLFGTGSIADHRDAVSVSAFVCQRIE